VHAPDLRQRGQQCVAGHAPPQPGQLGPTQAVGPLGAQEQVQPRTPRITVDEEHAGGSGQRHGRRDGAGPGTATAAAHGHQPAALDRRPHGGRCTGEQPRLVTGQHRDPLGTELDRRRPLGGREFPGGHDDHARAPGQRPERAAAERVGPDEDEGRGAVRAAQRRPSGGQLGLGAGGREEPEQVVEQVVVRADHEGAEGRGAGGGHGPTRPGGGQTVPERAPNCG
jgi:hypothetical protein